MDLKQASPNENIANTSQTQRIEALDIAKGIAIFLVVWMHCIQYIRKNRNYFYPQPIDNFHYFFHYRSNNGCRIYTIA